MPDNPYRLPRTVIPRRYRLRLEPDLEAATFAGSETIDVTVEAETAEIVLNAAEIDIVSAQITDGSVTVGASPRYDTEHERVTLDLETPIPAGDWELALDFKGTLNDKLRGFYRSQFVDVEGNRQYIATTQFESSDARRAFPCWDEPDLKATFQTTLVIPPDSMAITNTSEVNRRRLDDGRLEVAFAETMKMSTYLVAFVVGPFEATPPLDIDGVPTRIVAPRGKLHLTGYALECAEFCFRYLRDYYGIPYPGDKLDHIAVPDFAFGAMENVGAITYRETALLLDPEKAAQQEKQRILDVIGHEIAHQWFGNLVTMRWWEGIWLNEAFATFMELKATDAFRPEWKRWLTFGAVERPWAFGVDQLKATRPVEFEVVSPEEADEMFDALTYGKGSAVLRMLEQFIGEDAFRQGVGNYLRRHAYGNTVTADLWAGLAGASEWPVSEIMDTWIYQKGFPQLDVELDGERLRISQRRFLALPDDAETTSWKVPVQVRGVDESGREFRRALLLDEAETAVPVGPLRWVNANAGGHGFYRVHYSEPLFRALVEGLDHLADIERYNLLDDVAAFVLSGQTSITSQMELLAAYRDETEQTIWQLILTILTDTEHHIVDEPDLDEFRRFCRELLTPRAELLGWEPRPGEDDLTRRLRGQILMALGGRPGHDPATIEQAHRRLDEVFAGTSRLDPEVGRAVLFIAAHNGGPDEYAKALAGYLRNDSPAEQLRFLQALARFDDVALAERTMEMTLDGTIRSQDGAWVVASLFANRRSGGHAWTMARSRWDRLIEAFPPMSLRRLVEGIRHLSRPEVAADVRAFFAETQVPHASRAQAQNLELLEAHLATRLREGEPLSKWLRRRRES